MKLTAFSKILIIALILGVLLFLYKKYEPTLQEKFGSNPNSEMQTNAENPEAGTLPSSDGSNSSNQNNESTASSNSRTFSYSAPVPVNGKLKGVVELGAAGFNSFIVLIDDQKRWKLEKADFGSSLVHEKMVTDDDIRSGLKNYIRGMLDYGVAGKDIHFVVSSGAKNEEKVVKIAKGLKDIGYYVNEVTPQQEGTYGFQCVMPGSFEDKSFMVDMGSGNTKIAFKLNGKMTALETHGSKYFQKGISDAQVQTDVSKTVVQIPVNLRDYCFIIGGIPFEMAKEVRNGKERFTVLKAPTEYKPSGEKQKAGNVIYKAIADETGCNYFVFDWDANFTIGFLLGLK
ncbi:MAG: hypothetical protein IPH93_01760 [Saprospiraceae bacterium]|nr:hypothetical protein [Saprospiraceae bacterium]